MTGYSVTSYLSIVFVPSTKRVEPNEIRPVKGATVVTKIIGGAGFTVVPRSRSSIRHRYFDRKVRCTSLAGSVGRLQLMGLPHRVGRAVVPNASD